MQMCGIVLYAKPPQLFNRKDILSSVLESSTVAIL